MFSRLRLAAIFGMILTGAMVAFAQEPTQTPSAPREELRRERMRLRERQREGAKLHRREMRGHGDRGLFLRDLNLTDAQREQMRNMAERRRESIKSQREELFKMREKRMAGTFSAADEARVKVLRDEIHTAMQGLRAEGEAILTAEQKTRLAQLKVEREARFAERRVEREARREQRLKERQERMKQRDERLKSNPL
jgi:periplasmic protein CpxP/Spy